MNKEFNFLNIISNALSNSSYLGDDCAYLDEYNIAISKDCLIEDVHFSLNYMTPYEIAKKALLVNISDILASGALPKYALVGLCGNLNEKFVKDFYNGINEISNKYNIKIIGGDLTKAPKISISITIFGDYKNRNISSRKNAKENYTVAVAGEFGTSAQGLEDLINGIQDNYFINNHKAPKLYPEVSSEIAIKAKKPYAMMDSSDGLIDCLSQIATKSGVFTWMANELLILTKGSPIKILFALGLFTAFVSFPLAEEASEETDTPVEITSADTTFDKDSPSE